jgi:hypothetical protein
MMKDKFMYYFYWAWSTVSSYRMLGYTWRIWRFPRVALNVRDMYRLMKATEETKAMITEFLDVIGGGRA